MCSLVFFVTLVSACTDQAGNRSIAIIKAGESIFIPSDSVAGLDKSLHGEQIIIRIEGSRENMLGDYSYDNQGVIFTPLLRLTPGNTYEVLIEGKIISKLTVPLKKTEQTVELYAIYPSADTLPENLLKFYLLFSKPMRRGVSEKYIRLLNENGDTLQNIFLNLNSELWDEKGKQLTIWLDPGRIKRGLKPNERDGNPLKKGNSYTLSISEEWPDLQGSKLVKTYLKNFIASGKDIQSPDPSIWKMDIPKANSRQALSINFIEPLDQALLHNSVTVTDRDGVALKGRILVQESESSLLFYPDLPWSSSTYYLKIDSRLEDLAGNNLNRLFDRDLLKDKSAGKNDFYTEQFVVKKTGE